MSEHASALPRRKPLASRTWLLLAVVGVLYAPSLSLPFEPDEYLITGPAVGGSPWMGKPWDLYQFSSGRPPEVAQKVREGSFPWYTEPTFHYRLWRPLASLLVWGESQLYSARPGYQLHSLLWYAALIILASKLLRGLFPGALGLAAAWVFALNPLHVEPVTWVSARHVLIAQTLGIAALLVLVRSHAKSSPAQWTLAPLLFAAGLLTSESGLQPLGYAVAWAMGGSEGTVKSRSKPTVLLVLLAAIYFVTYRVMGRGAVGMGYIDVLHAPIPLLMSGLLVHRASMMLGELATTLRQPELQSVALALLVAGFAVARALSRLPEQERRPVQWLLGGSLLSLLPALPGYPEPRMLLTPSLGVAAGVAAVMLVAQRRAEESQGIRKFVLASWVAGVGVLHAGSALVRIPSALRESKEDHLRRIAALTSPELVANGAQNLVVLACDNWLFGQLGGYVRTRAGGSPLRSWQQLAESPLAIKLERLDQNRFALSPLVGDRLQLQYFRNTFHYPLHVGDRFEQQGIRIHVARVSGDDAARLEFTFPSSLDNARWAFARCTGEPNESIERVYLPEVGGELRLQPGAPTH